MSILSTVGPAAVGLVLAAAGAFISWRHDRWDRVCTFVELIAGVLLAHTVAPALTTVTGLVIFGVSFTAAITIWGLTWLWLEGWHQINWHAYRTLIFAFFIGACIGLTTTSFHVSAPGAGALMVGEAVIFAIKGRGGRKGVWLAGLGAALLSTVLIPQVRSLTGGMGISLLISFFLGVGCLAEAWWSGHKQGGKFHEWVTPACAFAGVLLVMVATGTPLAHLFGHAGDATLTAVNNVGSHTNLISSILGKIANNAVTFAHKAGGQ